MTGEQLGELINAMTRRHQERIDQLSNLLGSEGGVDVFELTSEVVGHGVSAADWLTSGQVGLNGAIPAVIALDPDGREAVLTYLRQIEYGVHV